ncbi:MAG: polysaccharide deacetylase family protein [Parcubacteria group bacterium]|nr:polysaccharide deacetylase family protein [Parcubacteria group bacterium]
MAKRLFFGHHYVRNGPAPGASASPERLRKQIEALLDGGWEFLTCGEIAGRMVGGRPLPERVASISFDDGLKDQYVNAFPILKELGVPATFFIITCTLKDELPPVIGFQILIDRIGVERMVLEVLPDAFAGTPYLDLLDPDRYDASGRKMGEPPEMRRIKWMFNHWPSQAFKRDMLAEMFRRCLGESAQGTMAREWFMSAEDICELQKAGMEIGSHSVTHPPFDVSGLAEIMTELVESASKIGETTGHSPVSFAWPFGGRFRPAVQELAGRFYSSAWNYFSALTTMPEGDYRFTNVPRLHEAKILPEL